MSEVKIIKQDGSPVDDETAEKPREVFDGPEAFDEIAKEINDGINKGLKGIRRFRNGIMFKLGLIAVAVKALDVAGKIIIENQRLKAEFKQKNDEDE